MREKALPENEVISILEKTKKRDYSYDRFFSTMCTLPHPIAVRAHDMFLETNLGDPGLFPGAAELEERVVQMLGELLGCPTPRATSPPAAQSPTSRPSGRPGMKRAKKTAI